MKLQFNQIAPITRGAAWIEEDTDGIHFHRFTREQEALYRQVSADYSKKTLATAGVRLVFRTDSRRITLAVKNTPGSSRNFAFVDVSANGETLAHIGSRENGIGIFGGEYRLEEGMKTVTVTFPWSVASVLQNLELDDGSSILPVPARRRMLIFGDSITQGYDAVYPTGSYAARLAEWLDADARNKGIAAEFFRPALAAIRDPDFEPELITVAYGGNDWWGHSKEQLESDLTGFYRTLSATYPDAKIFAVSPVWRRDWRDPNRKAGPFTDVAARIERTAAELPNVTHIPGFPLIPHDDALYSPDGLHPTDVGFAYDAERLCRQLLPYLNTDPV